MKADVDLTALDAALSALADIDPLQAKIVELRVFGGYTIDETADLAGCSHATVSREWQLARIWLYREMRGSEQLTPVRIITDAAAAHTSSRRDPETTMS